MARANLNDDAQSALCADFDCIEWDFNPTRASGTHERRKWRGGFTNPAGSWQKKETNGQGFTNFEINWFVEMDQGSSKRTVLPNRSEMVFPKTLFWFVETDARARSCYGCLSQHAAGCAERLQRRPSS